MVPCPWARHALAWLQSAPQMRVGVQMPTGQTDTLLIWLIEGDPAI